jgi:Mannosyl-glycoprotein endo-beta-N-acetylglucosaminidase/LysM domain
MMIGSVKFCRALPFANKSVQVTSYFNVIITKYTLPMRHTLRYVFLFIFFLFVEMGFAPAQITQAKMDSLDRERIQYISQYKQFAMREMERSGIPASITLAQGLLETSAGSSFLAKSANNHFGMKCGDRWEGATAYKHDDEYDAQGKPLKSCFRSYQSVEEGFADHSFFLLDPQKHNRYGALFLADPLDYVAWATGLQVSGYAPAGHYSARLIEFVERYRLHELDHETWTQPQLTLRERIFYINGTQVIRAREGESLQSIARESGIQSGTLLIANDMGYAANQALEHGTLVYLARKRDSWQSSDLEYYFTQDGKTMFDVAQLFGVRTAALRDMNGLGDSDEPALKAKIRLQGTRKSTDRVALRTAPIPRQTQPKTRNPKPPLDPVRSSFTMNAANTQALEQVLATPRVATRNVPPAPVRTTPPATNWPGAPAPAAEPTETADFEVTIGTMQFHDVASGDTLMAISRRYGVHVDELRRLNDLRSDNIRAGQRLRVR